MPATGQSVHFCSNVGGGVFGEGQVKAWRELGLDARLHYAVELEDYWRGKSGLWSKLRLRWAMYVRYPWMLWWAVRAGAPGDVFVAVTNPFFVPALAARAARMSGAPVVHLVYDLYPDALIFGGGWAPRHPAARFAAWTTRAAIRNCAATVYLGERLRRYAEAHYGVAPRTVVIPVGTDAMQFAGCEPKDRRPETGNRRPETGDRKPETGDRKPETGNRKPETGDRKPETGNRTTEGNEGNEGRRTEDLTAKNAESTKDGGRSLFVRSTRSGPRACRGAGDQGNEAEDGASTSDDPTVRCLYSGHMGRLHDWRTLADSLAGGLPEGLSVEIASDGPGAKALKVALAPVAQSSAGRLSFAGTRGSADWRAAMLAADVALVTMCPGAEKVVMPSKTYSAMAAGQAILAVCPRESDLADTVLAHDCGWVVAPGDVAGLRALLESLPARAEEVLQKRRNAWQAGQEVYDQRVLARQWREVLRDAKPY